MLAKLMNNGILVVDGFFIDSINYTYTATKNTEYIVRSAGIGEGDKNKCSGIFLSERVTGNLSDTVNKVWNSFSSELALSYMERIGAAVKPGVLIQPFITADVSYVIKSLNGEIYISSFQGDCSNIVNGNEGVLSFKLSETKFNEPVLDVFNKIKNILNVENLECEFIIKDNVVYTVQAMII